VNRLERLLAAFEARRAPQLEALRIGLGAALLVGFGGLTPELGELFGDAGWVSRHAFMTLRVDAGWPSIFAWVRTPAALAAVHACFLAAALAFTLGWGVRWVKWPLWALYVSYLNRDPAMVYGVDLLVANLLLLVCVAPVGSWLVVGRRGGAPPAGPRAAVCLALVRWQMALVFFWSAVEKLRGPLWWSGEALWVAANNVEFANLPSRWLAAHFGLTLLATHGALFVELAYPFLVWGRRTRPWALGAAVALHLGIALAMGLYLFAWVAIAGHLAFLRRRWLERAAEAVVASFGVAGAIVTAMRWRLHGGRAAPGGWAR
jgi:HTTM domain